MRAQKIRPTAAHAALHEHAHADSLGRRREEEVGGEGQQSPLGRRSCGEELSSRGVERIWVKRRGAWSGKELGSRAGRKRSWGEKRGAGVERSWAQGWRCGRCEAELGGEELAWRGVGGA